MIILVDESGSMLDSVIYSAVTASVFYSLRMMKVHLCIFDTSVVDLSAECMDPVETLMKVQLGGGTDIGQALAYAAELVENPRRTIVALITDFYEARRSSACTRRRRSWWRAASPRWDSPPWTNAPIRPTTTAWRPSSCRWAGTWVP